MERLISFVFFSLSPLLSLGVNRHSPPEPQVKVWMEYFDPRLKLTDLSCQGAKIFNFFWQKYFEKQNNIQINTIVYSILQKILYSFVKFIDNLCGRN